MNKQKEEIALLSIERSLLYLAASFIVSGLLIFWAWTLFRIYNPWGFIVAIPALILFFSSLWLMLNPFAMVFEDRFEIYHSFLQRKSRYFVDIKKISEQGRAEFYLTYNDDEVEKLNIRGIRLSQLSAFKNELLNKVDQSKLSRD